MTKPGTARPAGRRWTTEDEELLFRLVEEHGTEWGIIAEQMNRSSQACQAHFWIAAPEELKARFRRGPSELSPEQLEQAERLKSENPTRKECRWIAEKLGASPVAVMRALAPQHISPSKARYDPSDHRVESVVYIPAHVLRERERRLSVDRDPIREMFGDPAPGFSALDKMRAGMPV